MSLIYLRPYNAAELVAPQLDFLWTQSTNNAWLASANNLYRTDVKAIDNEIAHGALLPVGFYIDIDAGVGYSNIDYVSFLGVSSTYGSFNFTNTAAKFIAWYWGGSVWKDGSNIAGAPGGLTGPQRYRIAAKADGVIAMSKVSSDGLTLQGTPLIQTMSAGYDPAKLHIVAMAQAGYKTQGFTGYNALPGSGGL